MLPKGKATGGRRSCSYTKKACGRKGFFSSKAPQAIKLLLRNCIKIDIASQVKPRSFHVLKNIDP